MSERDSERVASDLRFFLEEVGEAVKECLGKRLQELRTPPESHADEDDKGNGNQKRRTLSPDQ